MNEELDNILNDCLERLLIKGETMAQCLQDHPEQAAELKPLLESAVVAQELSAIQPRAEFKARARYEFQSAIQDMIVSKDRPVFSWFPRMATVIASFAAVLLLGGTTVIAAGYSMPDDPLYQVKLTTEQIQLMLTFSDVDKANLCTQLSDRRVAEIIYMANKGDAQQVELVTARLDENLDLLASLAVATKEGGTDGGPMLALVPPSGTTTPTEESEAATGDAATNGSEPARTAEQAELAEAVKNQAEYTTDALRLALDEVPDSAKPALRQSIAVSVAGYNKALIALDTDDSASEIK